MESSEKLHYKIIKIPIASIKIPEKLSKEEKKEQRDFWSKKQSKYFDFVATMNGLAWDVTKNMDYVCSEHDGYMGRSCHPFSESSLSRVLFKKSQLFHLHTYDNQYVIMKIRSCTLKYFLDCLYDYFHNTLSDDKKPMYFTMRKNIYFESIGWNTNLNCWSLNWSKTNRYTT